MNIEKSDFDVAVSLWRDWNDKINVVSRKDIDNLYEHHVLHSLAIADFIQFKPGTKIMDLGTGGGFPGIPLAIMFPEVSFHLVDSIGKKIKVCQEVANALELKNVKNPGRLPRFMTGEEVEIENEPLRLTYDDLMNIDLRVISMPVEKLYNIQREEYKNMIMGMYVLDDDLRNDTCQSNLADERYLWHCGWIDRLRDAMMKMYENSNVYQMKYFENDVTQTQMTTTSNGHLKERFSDSIYLNSEY